MADLLLSMVKLLTVCLLLGSACGTITQEEVCRICEEACQPQACQPCQPQVEDDDVITKAQLLALVSNQQEQLKLITENLLRVTAGNQQMRVDNQQMRADLMQVTAENQQIASELVEVKQNMTSMNGTFGANFIRSGRTEDPETADRLYQDDVMAELQEVKAELFDAKYELLALKQRFQEMTGDLLGIAAKPGANYIRWGRTVCPHTATKLYQGRVAKSHYDHPGGVVEYLCLHDDPQQAEGGAAGYQHFSLIYGVEYRSILGHSGLWNHDAPCVACVVTARSQMIMIPGRRTCSAGWTLEYQGALAADSRGQKKTTYICLDRNPESVPGSGAHHNGDELYTVEAGCHGLCPPYTDGQEVTCAVCTK